MYLVYLSAINLPVRSVSILVPFGSGMHTKIPRKIRGAVHNLWMKKKR